MTTARSPKSAPSSTPVSTVHTAQTASDAKSSVMSKETKESKSSLTIEDIKKVFDTYGNLLNSQNTYQEYLTKGAETFSAGWRGGLRFVGLMDMKTKNEEEINPFKKLGLKEGKKQYMSQFLPMMGLALKQNQVSLFIEILEDLKTSIDQVIDANKEKFRGPLYIIQSNKLPKFAVALHTIRALIFKHLRTQKEFTDHIFELHQTLTEKTRIIDDMIKQSHLGNHIPQSTNSKLANLITERNELILRLFNLGDKLGTVDAINKNLIDISTLEVPDESFTPITSFNRHFSPDNKFHPSIPWIYQEDLPELWAYRVEKHSFPKNLKEWEEWDKSRQLQLLQQQTADQGKGIQLPAGQPGAAAAAGVPQSTPGNQKPAGNASGSQQQSAPSAASTGSEHKNDTSAQQQPAAAQSSAASTASSAAGAVTDPEVPLVPPAHQPATGADVGDSVKPVKNDSKGSQDSSAAKPAAVSNATSTPTDDEDKDEEDDDTLTLGYMKTLQQRSASQHSTAAVTSQLRVRGDESKATSTPRDGKDEAPAGVTKNLSTPRRTNDEKPKGVGAGSASLASWSAVGNSSKPKPKSTTTQSSQSTLLRPGATS